MGDQAAAKGRQSIAIRGVAVEPGGIARRHSHVEAATMTVEDLVVLARRTVHPHYVVEGMLTHCQCATCGRVERALRRVAAAPGPVTGAATPALSNPWAVPDPAADAKGRTLIQQWRERAELERADACAARPMSPALRSVHNHRGQVYDACADQLAAIHPPRPLV